LAFAGLDSSASLDMAKSLILRLSQLNTDSIVKVVNSFLSAREKLSAAERQELTDLLYGDYRQELIRRMKVGEPTLDSILSLTKLKHPELGWQELGKPAAADRVWQFTSFEPQATKDFMHPREQKRFRDVALPAGLENWYKPDFDASKWSSGKAPIGKGEIKQGNKVVENRSTWGEGEFLLMRTTFELESLDFDYYRVSILANQGYHIYLNGQRIHTYIWWASGVDYGAIMISPENAKYLRKGTNVLAVYANGAYSKEVAVGRADIRLEGLRKADLLGEPKPTE